MSVEDLMKPRMKVIKGFPNSAFSIGEIICEPSAQQTEWSNEFPYLFKWMEWWEERSHEQFLSVKFVRVKKYVGYWVEGDIVPAEYKIQSEGRGISRGYNLKYNHFQILQTVEPATKEEYDSYIKLKK